MSNLCKTQLCSVVQNAACNSSIAACTVTDALFSTVAADAIQPTNRMSNVLFDDLPAASSVQNGHIAFLDETFVPVIASNGTWIGLDGRIPGTFVVNPLFAWGWGVRGNLGNGSTSTFSSPTTREICSATDWCQISAGLNYNSAALKTSGQIWAWGYNNCGQIGDGTTVNKCSPVREICSATDWCQVDAGRQHTSAIKTSGEIWVWGTGRFGSLGDGTLLDRCSPVREICSATDWCQVSASFFRTAALKTSGQLWAWGYNGAGQIGDGTYTVRCSPVREFCSATDWCQVHAGDVHTVAIKTSGQLWAWGCNTCGRLGDGSVANRCSPVREFCSATDWCQASAGSAHTAAVKTSGELWAWGSNANGRLGAGTVTDSFSPIREFCNANNWCCTNAGNAHTMAINTKGELWGWGYNGCFRLGDGTATTRCSPVREVSSSTDWCQVSTTSNFTLGLQSFVCVCR